MGKLTPNPKKRSFLLPTGGKKLIDASQPAAKVNGQIRAKELRVIGAEGEQLEIMSLAEALQLARSQGIDLVEIAPQTKPPICRVVDYGRFRYECSLKRKKHS